MAPVGRKTQYQVIHEISVEFGYGQTAGLVGVLPKGAILITTRVLTSQVFNSTTNVLDVGTTLGGDQLIANADMKTISRVDTPVPAANMGPLDRDTPIYYSIASSGPAPTQGVCTAWLEYLPAVG